MYAIYARQSLDKKDSISIEAQIEICKKEFDSKNESYRVFSDRGFSGKDIDRPAFSELLEAVNKGEVSKVIIYRLDRFSRSVADFAQIMRLFEQKKVDFVSCKEKFDTSTPMGKAMLYIIMVFAQLERETIAERVRDNYYTRGKTGVFLGGPPPLGMINTTKNINGKNVKVLEYTEDIKVVKYLFESYAGNKSLGQIAREAKELYGDKYGVWNNVKISRILHNPVYVKADADIYAHYSLKGCIMANNIDEYTGERACYIFGKRDRGKNKYRNLNEQVVVLAHHEGVIDSKLFLACQYKLEKNQQIKNTGKGKHTWLSGLLVCAYCGRRFVVKSPRGNQKYLYCAGRQSNQCDLSHNIPLLSEIEKTVEAEIKELLKREETEEANVQEVIEDSETNQLKIEIFKLEQQISRLVSSIAESDDVVIPYINAKIAALDANKKELQEQLLSRHKKASYVVPKIKEWESADFESKKYITKKLIDKIILSDKEIEIKWRY